MIDPTERWRRQHGLDAKAAWAEFVEDGTGHGFLDLNNATVVSRLAPTYGYRVDSQFGYYRGSVLQAIWSKAGEKFRAAESDIR